MERFKAALSHSSRLFIPYLMAGDPQPQVTVELLHLLQEEGATAIELGVPFSDPSADGPVIQQAGIRALQQGVNLKQVLTMAEQARQQGLQIPLILFSYLNPILQYGIDQLVKEAKQAGFDGMIVPDLSFEENSLLKEPMQRENLSLIPLVAPTSKNRIKRLVQEADTFVYCVSSLGTTGMRSRFADNIFSFLQDVKEVSPVPAVVGFGVSTSEHVQQFSEWADGAVIGSALIQQIEQATPLLTNPTTRAQGLDLIRRFIREIHG